MVFETAKRMCRYNFLMKKKHIYKTIILQTKLHKYFFTANRTETSAWKKNSIKKPALKPKPPSFKDRQAPNIESIKSQLPCLKDSSSPVNCKLTVLKPAWSGSKTPQHSHRYVRKIDKVEKEAKEVETILQRTVYDTAKLFGTTPVVRNNALLNQDRYLTFIRFKKIDSNNFFI